jgi:diguanylate cyclase (GGDEF)-like protein
MLRQVLKYFARHRADAPGAQQREQRNHLRGQFPAHVTRVVATAVMGVTLSVCAWLVASHWENRVAELEFSARANNIASTLQTGLNEYLAKIVALRALFEASDHVTRDEFQSFADRILQSQPAILSMSWIPRVSREDQAEHERAAIQDGIANYRIRSVTPDGSLVTSGEDSEYFPVYYTTEKQHADAIYGLDLGDGGMREETLKRARDSNRLAASSSLLLQTGLGDRRGFFVLLPLYKRGSHYQTIEERRANLIGFVQGVFKIDVMVDTILSGIKSPLDFFIYPSSIGSGATPLHIRTTGPRPARPDSIDVPGTRLRWSGDVKVADIRWTLMAVPSVGRSAFVHLSAWILLGAGLLVTVFGVALVWSSGRYSRRLLQSNRKVSELALTDLLTGLPNRRAFFDRLSASFSATAGSSVSVLFIDLDDFKDVNDTLGHSTGDKLLRQAAQRLQASIEETDMVARFGGDEFAILRIAPIDRTQIGMLAATIVDVLAGRYRVDGNEIHITASVGVTCSSHDVAGPETVMMQADLALYRAKEDGRNCFRFHDWALDEKFRERVTIGDELRVGIERGELRLHYQPQVEIPSGRLTGLEALVRWHHPKRGLIPPSVFIPIAEKTGAIIPLGRWVFEEACRQLSAWRAEGIAPQTLAVNLSAIQCRQANLEKEFREIMTRYAVDPGVLEVELTESVLMDNNPQQRDIIERLKSLGLKVAIDDFGTGYSSLNYLAAYPVDRLKIAQELVFRVTMDLKHDLVVKAAVRLAHELGIEVIAEGVETEAQARFLVAAECKYAQGYFFNPPLAADATTALLRQGRVNLFAGAKPLNEATADVAPRLYPRLQVSERL